MHVLVWDSLTAEKIHEVGRSIHEGVIKPGSFNLHLLHGVRAALFDYQKTSYRLPRGKEANIMGKQ